MARRANLTLLSLLIVFALIAGWIRHQPLPDAAERLANFPTKAPGIVSKRIPLSSFEEAMLGEATASKRLYQWKGRTYAIMMIDGTHDRNAVHDPRYCYRGAGWKILEENPQPIPGGSGRHLRLKRSEKESHALFYYSTGQTAFAQPLEYWSRATLRRWTRGHFSAEPILVLIEPLFQTDQFESEVVHFLSLLQLP